MLNPYVEIYYPPTDILFCGQNKPDEMNNNEKQKEIKVNKIEDIEQENQININKRNQNEVAIMK